ncbi:MAG TPA: ribonuclease III [Anaeromyxobacteraceae bacterium]|nr:ribonuclease III [Anaeromyxobacteraceae bacterium]
MSREAMEPPPHPRPERPPQHPVVVSLEERIGLAISDGELALAALTHKSYVNEHRGEALRDNERLEFLGDAVIDLAVSHRLMERFPQAREGELSKIRAAVVDEAGLARMARELDLGALLRLGRGEELTGGRQKSSLLADALEAVVAAIYLCGGLDPVLTLIDRFLGEAFARAAAGTLDRDYKTQLQELAQSRLRATPRYRVVAEHGPDHSKVFDVELELRGEVVGRGAGRSKKDAEQAAAKLALEAVNGRLAEEGTAASPAAAAAPPSEAAFAPEPPAVELEMAAEAAAEAPLAVAETAPPAAPAAGAEPAPEPEPPMPAPEPEPARAPAAPRRKATTARKVKRAPARAPAAKSKPKPRARAPKSRGAASKARRRTRRTPAR